MDHKLPTYQQVLWDKVRAGGFKHGEMMIMSSGRQTGKSQLNHYLQPWYSMLETTAPKYKIITQAEVDDRPWYTITCQKDVSMWVRENGIENTDWYEHIDGNWNVHRNMFDVCEELYMLIVLKFGRQ